MEVFWHFNIDICVINRFHRVFWYFSYFFPNFYSEIYWRVFQTSQRVGDICAIQMARVTSSGSQIWSSAVSLNVRFSSSTWWGTCRRMVVRLLLVVICFSFLLFFFLLTSKVHYYLLCCLVFNFISHFYRSFFFQFSSSIIISYMFCFSFQSSFF